jgi:hypothetical protein
MGGTALSPLEQLGQSVGQGSQTATPSQQSQLSPLEQLGQSVNATPSGPSDAQTAYRQATASGPYAPAGGAEKAIGQEFGDNAGQARQALKSGDQAALATAAGVTGAGPAAMSLEAAAPLVTTLAEHLPTLDKAYKILTAIGAGSYTVQHLKDVMKIIGGGK